MRCMTCGAESRPDAKFCETCGSPLQQAPQQGRSVGQAADLQQQQWQNTETSQSTTAGTYQRSTVQTPVREPQPPQGRQASGAPFVLAIIALVTALLGLFPVSLVLAIIALAMNSGQKKRGEASTRQTPTFVMGLISLILSILVAVATLLLGGVVWLVLMDDDPGAGGATTAQSQPAAEASAAGVWSIVSLTDDGETYDAEYLDLMESMGMSFDLVLAEDGTASLEFFDMSVTGTWKGRGSGKVEITFDGDTVEGTIEGEELTLSWDGDDMVFRRMSETAPATVGSGSDDEGSSSAAASSLSSSSKSSSSPSASKAAESYDADGEPTLGDFSWYAGAGGVPAGATTLSKFADVKGNWKAYVFGSGLDRLCKVKIAGKKDSATATVDWLYVHDGSNDTGRADDTPDSVFDGDWDSSLGLEVLGSGRIALTDFWQKGGRQYGMGSFMWPSGETDTILLVRP